MSESISRRNFLKLAGTGLAGAALVAAANPGLLEWQETLSLPVPPAGSKNVLLIVMDTVRAQNLELFGYGRNTMPRLAQFAKSGVVFDQALSTAPWTLPAHASLFTGRWHHELSANWAVPLDNRYPTLAEYFRSMGYLTAGFAGNTFYLSREHGVHRGFTHYEDYLVRPDEILVNSSLLRTVANSPTFRKITKYPDIITRKSAREMNERFIKWLSRKPEKPFFAFFNYLEAHEPYLPESPYDGKFGAKINRDHSAVSHELRKSLRWDRIYMPPEMLQAEIDAYDGALAYLDDQIAWLLEQLQQMNLLEDTLVIITSDHGEQFGEHRLFGHGNSLYWPSLHVPLILSLPGTLPAGIRVSQGVSLRDLPATILESLGSNGRDQFPGKSLSRYWNTSSTAQQESVLCEVTANEVHYDWYPTANGDLKSIVFENYQYIRNGNGAEELYDIKDDPGEENDLSRGTIGGRMLADFREQMDKMLVG